MVHTHRHSFVTHLLEEGDIRTVQELLGQSTVQKTIVYTHVAKKNVLSIHSSMDAVIIPEHLRHAHKHYSSDKAIQRTVKCR